MHLDVPTLMVMGSFVAACAGGVLLIAWLGNRNTPALAIWGIANLLTAGGVFCLMLGQAWQEPALFALAGNVLAVAHGLIWKAARSFDRKPAPLIVALLGLIILGIMGVVPVLRDSASGAGFVINAVYLSLAVGSLWLDRNRPLLPARWPILFFTSVHAAIMIAGARHAFIGAEAQDQIPSLMSLFGVIHFESIVFSVGTAVFILALVKERSEAASRIAAGVDSLTGIANRSAFMDAATRVIERCRHDNAPVAVIMFDLDRFKTINDTYGHAEGDAVLRKFCEVTAAALRPNDIFGRLGGEEFAAVLPRSDIEPAYVRAERIRAAFAEECHVVGACQVHATVSGGVSVSVNAKTTLSELLGLSDQALYRAKAGGRNRIKRAEQTTPQSGLSAVIRVA